MDLTLNIHSVLMVIRSLPFYAIVLFCCYSLAAIGWGLITFPECDDAERELQLDIQRARTGLAHKGVKLE